jgi:hypothetical protein
MQETVRPDPQLEQFATPLQFEVVNTPDRTLRLTPDRTKAGKIMLTD